MTLVGRAARNHRQKPIDDAVDDRRTCPGLWLELQSRFRFTIDAAASPTNAMLPRYWTRTDNALCQSWAVERVWCNPPYSRLEPWILKAWAEAACPLIVMLVPNNRPEQGFWQRLVEPYRDRPGSRLRVEFLAGRPRFELPNGNQLGRPPFGLCLLIWEWLCPPMEAR